MIQINIFLTYSIIINIQQKKHTTPTNIMQVSKEDQSQIVDWFVTQLKKLNLSDKTIGCHMRAYHIHLPVYTSLVILFASQLYNMILLVMLFMAFISFFIFNGCILTKIENKLDNINNTMMDPFLEIGKYELTTKNRMYVSTIAGSFYLFLACFIYYIRFGTFYLQNSVYDELNIFQNFCQNKKNTTTTTTTTNKNSLQI